ncbi:coil containing protein [Vibrio phage 1.028.O._10N.286.45.B6]|uniref:hypothetical protein n=1 Tax=unclassified Vibrio TaxID=2614977 RepID=UPI000CA125A1|nr:coil containing protein [Vibrio phage 1.028.O._10N.286.45.B6]AUR90014.1 head morphogenesis domain protein [Vibrio phage 1.136.O._10N.261.45.E11]AUR90332.1 coil containing protein [Vibrio phage 1.142.O._10N.261.49.E11]AUR91128.1 coil containing protein [Vibrio phage 1.156.O._10N.261.45.A6]AUR91309.1 coil containing protein [Vibrio phage 1.159.O._10N.261.46.F12]AUR96207.1 coil containing protein [Vibrio phage 1.217.O._10N.261.45.A1]AUR96257.1 coil containing protein [Vibrio phage 1.219.O._10
MTMPNPLQRSFTTAHTRRVVDLEIEMAEALIEKDGTAFPDSTFEEGYIAALKFILNQSSSNVREEYEDMMDELNGKDESEAA